MVYLINANIFSGIFLCISLAQIVWCSKNESTIYKELILKNCLPIEAFNLNSTHNFDINDQEENVRSTFTLNSISKHIIMHPSERILSFYKLKLINLASGTSSFLEINVRNLNRKTCIRSNQSKRELDSHNKSKIKFLFADSILSYDFHNMWLDDDRNVSSRTHTVYFPENILVDSFICYVLVKSNLEIVVKNNNEAMFKLEKVNSGSSQLLLSADTNKNSQQLISPVLTLYLLKLARALDRERHDLYELNFRILNENSPSSILRIVVTDVNDNTPQFVQPVYKFDLVENDSHKLCFGIVQAYDRDLGVNSMVRYYILNDSLVTYRNVDHEGRGKQVYQIGNSIYSREIVFKAL